MKIKEQLQKNANWWAPTPERVEYAYDTNMHMSDREKLNKEIEKEKASQKGIKKFLIQHGPAAGMVAGGLMGGLAAHRLSKGDKSKAALVGAGTGAGVGALLGFGPGLRAGKRVEESFEKNNPDFMKRYYEDPRRLDRQLKKQEIYAIRERNWANRYDEN